MLLDAENLADYMLIIFYTGGFDTGISRWIGDNVANNWFGIYNRVAADQGFQFFIHDNEHSLGADYPDHASQFIDRTGPFNNGNQNNFAQFAPPFLHQDLLASPEYKQLFIDRVQKFMFNGGALTIGGKRRALAGAEKSGRSRRSLPRRPAGAIRKSSRPTTRPTGRTKSTGW